MFKASKHLNLNMNSDNQTESYSSGLSSIFGSGDNMENECLFGKYQKTPDADSYPVDEPIVFVSPELTDTTKAQLLHFPSGVCKINSEVKFTIKRNGLKGNFEVKLEYPNSDVYLVPLKTIDPERIAVSFQLKQAGLYKVHIKCNSVDLPKSPYIIVSISGDTLNEKRKIEIPIFRSSAEKVTCRGLGLSYIYLNERNEFTVDATEAGTNMLFVGMFGPHGQCDEIVIKHVGKNLYKVTYEVKDHGDYILAIKWGEEHVAGSPFYLSAI